MKPRSVVALLALVAGGLPIATASPCFAVSEGVNRAAVVIEVGDDTATFCVGFDEPELSGLEALRRTGVGLVVEDYGAGQVTICRIGEIGCAHPRESCWCECPGTGACTYWGYFRASGDEPWRFSELGAASTVVRDGDREGWRYGPHTPASGNAPRTIKGECILDAAFLAAGTPEASSGRSLLMTLAIALLVIAGLGALARRRSGGAS